jgi:hypothetical protein
MTPIIHDVFLGWARGSYVNGRMVAKAEIIEENSIFTARLTDGFGTEYVSGSNNRDYHAELMVMKSMCDPAI